MSAKPTSDQPIFRTLVKELVKEFVSSKGTTEKFKDFTDALHQWAAQSNKGQFVFPLPEKSTARKKLQNLASDFSQLLENVVVGKWNFPQTLVLGTAKKNTRQTISEKHALVLTWNEPDSKPAEVPDVVAPRKITFLTSYHECSFVDQLLCGARSIADERGIEFEVVRVRSDRELCETIKERERNATQKNSPDPDTLYVIDWSSPSTTEYVDELVSLKVNIIETVNHNATFSQNNIEIGRLAAKIIDDLGVPRKKAKVGIIVPHLTENFSPTTVRKQTFEQKLREMMPSIEFIEVHTPDLRMHSTLTETIRVVCAAVDMHPDLDAVYATSGDATIATVAALHAKEKNIPVIGTDFLSELIPLLSEPSSVLQGLVGVDPYSYGRQKMRFSLDHPEERGQESVKPLSLSKKHYLGRSKSVYSMFELSREYEDYVTESGSDRSSLLGDPSSPSSIKSTVIGVAGGSGSGKSTIADEVRALFPFGEVTVLSIDSFYFDSLPDGLNYEEPKAIDWECLVNVLSSLKNGEITRVPRYCFHNSRRSTCVYVCPSPLILVEGLHALNDQISSLIDIRFFLDVSEEIRLNRRIQRDVRHRGRSQKSVEDDWNSKVQPAYKKCVSLQKDYPKTNVISSNDKAKPYDVAKQIFEHVCRILNRDGGKFYIIVVGFERIASLNIINNGCRNCRLEPIQHFEERL